MSIQLIDHRGVYVRPDTDDAAIVNQQGDTKLLKLEGKNVLDLGANIGSFAVRALERGANYVVAVEPEPENLAVLQANLGRQEFVGKNHVIGAAAVRTVADDYVDMWVNKGKGKGMHSLIEKRGRDKIKVPAVALSNIIDNIQVVKCDIEGFEYVLFNDYFFPPLVTDLAIEFHITLVKDGQAKARALYEHIVNQGFRVLKEPHIDTKAWSVMGVFER